MNETRNSQPLRLFIASVHTSRDDGERWYQLQRRFVHEKTRCDFHYGIVLNGASPEDFDSRDILWANEENIGHAPALAQIVEHFRTTDHDAYLILDSDCFPVAEHWEQVLMKQLRAFDKHFAAPIRTENLDVFPHPCAFFMLREGLNDPRLTFDKGETWNLIGDRISDVGGRLEGTYDACLPLLRTNVVNLHPMAAAIYHHLFYHHHAGSRNFNCRVIDRYFLYDHWYQRDGQTEHVRSIEERLFQDPDRFLDQLMGREKGPLAPCFTSDYAERVSPWWRRFLPSGRA